MTNKVLVIDNDSQSEGFGLRGTRTGWILPQSGSEAIPKPLSKSVGPHRSRD
jgi:hypothetical protein